MTEKTADADCKSDRIARRVVACCTGVVALLTVLMEPGFAGTGKLTNGKFNLSMSVRFDASGATISALETRFQEASELLFDATDGQHQFGTIRVCNNSRGGRNADIWLRSNGRPPGCDDMIDNDGDGLTDEEFPDGVDNDGDGAIDEDNACARSYVPGGCAPGLGTVAASGTTGCQIMLFEDDALSAGNASADGRHVIVHEFGHYGYGIFDEYVQKNGDPAICLVPPFTPASLMENFWNRPISEFCVPSNHDQDDPGTPQNEAGDTRQDVENNGESSWETMVRNFPDLTLPTGLPAGGPSGAATINWQLLEPETRLVLVIDRSGSMNFPPDKIGNAKLGAKIFVDLVSVGDKLGVVSFASTASVDFPIAEVANGTKAGAKTIIDGISADGATSIGGGLRAALNQVLAAGDPACQQVIVLLTNGRQNTGENPSTVLPDLKDAGIVVHTIGLGADTDISLLSNIANETNGRFFPAASAAELFDAFSTLFAESTENGGLISSALTPLMTGEGSEEIVTIDSLTPESTFLVTWPGVADIDLTLVRPDSTVITPATANVDPNITFASGSNHELYTVLSPQVGQWTMQIQAVAVTGEVEVTAQTLGVSPDISFTATANKESFVFPEPVLVQATPMAPVNVVGATVDGTVTRPDGSSVPLSLFDDGLDTHGDTFAEDGVYSNFFSDFNEDGTYSFELVATTSSGFLFAGEGLFAFLDLGFIPPEGASNVPAPTFVRIAGFAVTVSGVPASITVAIDIKPNKVPNPVNLKSKDVIPVAILTTAIFDATTVDPLSVEFGPDGAFEAHGRGHIKDADSDGDLDLVLHFAVRDTGIVCGDTSASLTGEAFDGQPIEGADSIKTVGCK